MDYQIRELSRGENDIRTAARRRAMQTRLSPWRPLSPMNGLSLYCIPPHQLGMPGDTVVHLRMHPRDAYTAREFFASGEARPLTGVIMDEGYPEQERQTFCEQRVFMRGDDNNTTYSQALPYLNSAWHSWRGKWCDGCMGPVPFGCGFYGS